MEAYAGGAGVALHLLTGEYVEEIVLNDLDSGVAAFWRAVFFDTANFLARLRRAPLTVAMWRRQRRIYSAGGADDSALGFATFFLNRTNRSGILDGRPIGGYAQEGDWTIAARFNRAALEARIRRVAAYRSRVTVLQEDGVAVARRYAGVPGTFVYLDPPYIHKGERLYLDTLEWKDHKALARALRGRPGWFLTYDTDRRVGRDLYPDHRRARYELAHTAGRHHAGSEFAVFAHGLDVPELEGLGTGARFVQTRAI
ncbi:MAG: DNA adenine methylase [Chloroflexota bacterium]|nr:DNA adenine methylase [Chloroflexota bacterium]